MEMTEDKKEIKQISIRNDDKSDIILHSWGTSELSFLVL